MSHWSNLRSKNEGNLILSYINIYSIRNKIESLCELVTCNVDILPTAETKLGPLFRNLQFLIPGFHKPLKMDISCQKGELLVYIKFSFSSKMLTKFKLPDYIQLIPFEWNLRKRSGWLFVFLKCHYKTINISSVF